MSYNFDTDQNHYYFNNKNSLPIIFIHCVGLNQQMWKPQIEFFKDNSFITYDLLGHGKTPFKEPNLSMENFTDQLSNLLNNLKICLLYTSPSPRDGLLSRMPSSA